MNKFQRKALVLAGNVSLIAFSTIAATVATVAWYGGTQTVTATNLTISCSKAEDSITWNILKYDDDQKAGICYNDEAEFYLPPYDQYIPSKNIYSNVLLRVDVYTPSGFGDENQLYVDVTCDHPLLDDGIISSFTSNICEFKATVANYTNTEGETIITNSSIDMTNDDTQYRTVSSFFEGTTSGSVSFTNVINNTATKVRDNVITVIPHFYCGDDVVKKFVVFLECSYKPSLVDYYIAQHVGDNVDGGTIDLVGDITSIDFRFGEVYTGAYVKVNGQEDLTTQDDYMIAYENYEVALDGSGTRSEHYNTGQNYIPVEVNRSMIKNNETVNKSDFNYTSDYNIQSHAGFNIGGTSAAVARGLAASRSTSYPNTLTYQDGDVRTVSNEKYLRYDIAQGFTNYNYFANEGYLSSRAIQYFKYEDTDAANAVLTGIIISGTYKTEFTIGQFFSHEGMIVTAQYSDGSTSPVQSKCVWTGYNMNAATNQTVTVSYTEDGVTVNADYRISVTSGPTVTVTPSILIGLAGDFGILRARTAFFGGNVTYTWSVNDISVASLSDEHGESIEVSYLKSGYCTVTCVARDDQGNEDSATVNVRVSGELTDADTFVKVTSNDQLTEGEYLIVYETGSVCFDGSLTTLDAVNNNIPVIIKDNMIAATSETNAAVFVYTPGNTPDTATFVSKSSLYIGNTTSGNALTTSAGALNNNVSIDADGNAVIKATNNATASYLRFNKASNQMRFRYYKTGQEPIQLYKKTNNNANLRLVSIQLRGEFKTNFYTRDRFEIGQGRVYAKYNNNSMRDVTDLCTFSGYNMNVPGRQTVTVSLTQLGETKTARYEILITSPLLTGLSVDVSEATLNFDYGSHFSSNGVHVIATYANGSRNEVTALCDFSGYPADMDVLGDHEVTVTYTEGAVTLTGTYTISINAVADGFKLVTDAAQLQNGDHVIIAAAESNFAVSKTQNGNNRGQTAVTKTGQYLTYEGAQVAVFVITSEANNTWSFYDQANNGYIYAASSSSNYLRTKAELDNNGRWSISASGIGIATMRATGNYSRNLLRYNKTSSLFSCYSSGQLDIALYRYVGEYVEPVIHATRVTVDANFLDLVLGDPDHQIIATVTPADAIDKRVSYVSSNSDVATVSEDGLIHPVAPGVATITVASVDVPSVRTSITVTVTRPYIPVTEIVIDSPNQVLDVGDTVQLSAHVMPANATVQDVSWSSDEPAIAEITSSGLVTAMAPGTVLMTCYAADDSEIYGTVQVIVRGGAFIPVSSVSLGEYDNEEFEMRVEDEIQLTATVLPDDATNKAVRWESSDPSKVQVNASGKITALAVTGEDDPVYISATSEDNPSAVGICAVTVLPKIVPAKPTTWELVTDISMLENDAQVIIAAANGGYALGTTGNNSKTNRYAGEVTISNGILTFDSSSTVAILDLGGNGTTGWTFYDSINSGYLSANKSSNQLKTVASSSDNLAKWNISVTSSGLATIQTRGTAASPYMRFNSGNNPKIFSCYNSATNQQNISIFVNTGLTYVRDRIRQSTNRSVTETISFIKNISKLFTNLINIHVSKYVHNTSTIISKNSRDVLSISSKTNNTETIERMVTKLWQIKIS